MLTTKWFIAVLILALIYLQYRLWIAEGSLATVVSLQNEISQQQEENRRLRERNRLLAAEVEALQTQDSAIEERSRTDLGLIKEGETFFMLVQPGSERSEEQ